VIHKPGTFERIGARIDTVLRRAARNPILRFIGAAIIWIGTLIFVAGCGAVAVTLLIGLPLALVGVSHFLYHGLSLWAIAGAAIGAVYWAAFSVWLPLHEGRIRRRYEREYEATVGSSNEHTRFEPTDP
jgi:hypothetical protein